MNRIALPNPPSFMAFTVKANGGLINAVITDVVISLPFDPRTQGQPDHPGTRTKALWDTGASQSCISKKIVDSLNIEPTGSQMVAHAAGMHIVGTYSVSILLPNNVGVSPIRVSEFAGHDGFDALIGMDIITKGDFSITNVGGVSIISFRTPSIKTIDYVRESEQLDAMTKRDGSIGRNDLCPCGTGRKYKNCHGR